MSLPKEAHITMFDSRYIRAENYQSQTLRVLIAPQGGVGAL